jgi:hypothetical protein
MGGYASHDHASFAAQTAAFLASLLMPGAALALVMGAYWEQFRRGAAVRRAAKQVRKAAPLAAEWSAE